VFKLLFLDSLVAVIVNNYRYLSQAARIAIGILAGNAFIEAEVIFTDLSNNTSAGTRKYSTSSSAGQGIFSAVTDKQIRAICDEIVKELSQQQ
jgi:hypothetical protein